MSTLTCLTGLVYCFCACISVCLACAYWQLVSTAKPTREDRIALAQQLAAVPTSSQGHILLFVHGYNNTNLEAVVKATAVGTQSFRACQCRMGKHLNSGRAVTYYRLAS